MSHPLLERAHLEAVLLARVLLDPELAGAVALDRLSPAALTLLLAAVQDPAGAGGAGLLAVAVPSGDRTQDAFVVRLAKRVEALSLLDLTFYPRETLLALVNRLPVLHADRDALDARLARAIDARAWVADVVARRIARRTA